MNAPQVHLMLNHVPVLGIVFVAITLIVGLVWRRSTLLRFGLFLLIGISLVAVPVYFSGGRSEEAIEHLAGVQRGTVETHEDMGRLATVALAVLGAAALVVVVAFRRRDVAPGAAAAVLVAVLVLSGVMAWTAHTGGLIRHDELRDPITAVDHEARSTDGD